MIKKTYDSRLNVYLNQRTRDRLDEYCEANNLSLSSAVNMILNQYFDGQEAMKSMGNLTELMKVFASQTGIDLSGTGNQKGADA